MSTGRRMDNGRYGKVFSHILTKEYLIQEYVNNNKSPYVIAKNIGCDPHTIYSYLDHYQIPRINYKGEINPGQKFNFLTTIKIIGKTKNGTFKWLCACDCGKEVVVATTVLKNESTRSCGCYRARKGSQNKFFKGYCDVSGNLVSEIRLRARKKKIDFNLTAKFLWELFLKQDKKCAISGINIELCKNASVDRIDSKKGYTEDNVWWTHKDINKMKMDIELSQFLKYCEIITLNQRKGDQLR